MEQDAVLMAAYRRVLTTGSYSVKCKSEREATLLRFRIYGFLKKFRKDLTLGGKDRSEIARAIATTALVIEGQELHFRNRAETGGMQELTALIGEEARALEGSGEQALQEAGQRLLDSIGKSNPYPTHGND